jgi:hypothetical protein
MGRRRTYTLRNAASIVFALTAVIPLLLFTYTLYSLNQLRLTEAQLGMLDQLEEKGLLGYGQNTIHCTGAFTDELPAVGFDPQRPRAKDLWTSGMAQLLADLTSTCQISKHKSSPPFPRPCTRNLRLTTLRDGMRASAWDTVARLPKQSPSR